MELDIPHLSLRFLESSSATSILRSTVIATWWAMSKVSYQKSMVCVFLLNNLADKRVSVVTNDWEVVDFILGEQSFESSFKKWYESEILAEGDWDIKLPSEKVLKDLCSKYACISSILEFSKVKKKLVFATIRHVKPEDVQSLSQMLLLFGGLNREENFSVDWSKLHPVVANFLEKMMHTGLIDLTWLNYDKDDPESLIWKEDLGYLA